MGIVIDFEEAKRKLFTPAEQMRSSEKLDKVKSAAATFLFSRQPLRNRVFMILRGALDNLPSTPLNVPDEVLSQFVNELLPYIQANFLKPYVAPEKVNESTETPAE